MAAEILLFPVQRRALRRLSMARAQRAMLVMWLHWRADEERLTRACRVWCTGLVLMRHDFRWALARLRRWRRGAF